MRGEKAVRKWKKSGWQNRRFESGKGNTSGKAASYEFYVSDAAEKFTHFANTILSYDVAATKLVNIEEY